jgi:hypothetical protein
MAWTTRGGVNSVPFTPHTVGRTFVITWGEVEVQDLADIRVQLKALGSSLGRLPVYIAITPPNAPPPRDDVRKEMLATMGETSALTETLHLVLEGSGLKYSALRSMVASMFLLAGNRRIFVHDTLTDALKKTSLDDKERGDVLMALGYAGSTRAS